MAGPLASCGALVKEPAPGTSTDVGDAAGVRGSAGSRYKSNRKPSWARDAPGRPFGAPGHRSTLHDLRPGISSLSRLSRKARSVASFGRMLCLVLSRVDKEIDVHSRTGKAMVEHGKAANHRVARAERVQCLCDPNEVCASERVRTARCLLRQLPQPAFTTSTRTARSAGIGCHDVGRYVRWP